MLVRFDPAFAQADVASLQQRIASLTAQTERLEAQLSGAPFSAGPEDGPERNTQGQIYAQEMSDYQAEISQRDSRLARSNPRSTPTRTSARHSLPARHGATR